MTKNILVAGAGGMIGGHLVKRLLDEGFNVRAVDVKPYTSWWQWHNKADNWPDTDLSYSGSANAVTKDMDEVYMLAADMGGMGFIENHKLDCMNSALITGNMLRHSLGNDVQRYFFSSSACVYSRAYQQTTDNVYLSEDMVYPADPEPGYGLEKLFSEELTIQYGKETRLETRVARYHNVYGTHSTYNDGREKAPAAICRKIATAAVTKDYEIEIWGDGKQTRSFMYMDDCIEGTRRIMDSNIEVPINLGSDELVSINDLVSIVEEIADIRVNRYHKLDAPTGVRGRCSDNALINDLLGWEPNTDLSEGLAKLYPWIYDKVVADVKAREGVLE